MFLMELCLALGCASPRKLIGEMTSEDLTMWVAFAELRPFGFRRESELFGTLVAQQYNLHREPNTRARSWLDVFPVEVKLKDAEGRDTDESIIALFQQYNLERGYAADGKVR